jgi:hypothetical protein
MKTEARFLIAIGLMLAVLIGTNIIFPTIRPRIPTRFLRIRSRPPALRCRR